MLFNSYEFIFIFLPVTLGIYFGLIQYRYTKLATAFLVLASLAFYSYWDLRNLPILVGSIVFNFAIGAFIERRRDRQALFLGVFSNLALLVYFKYTSFLVNSINEVFGTSFFSPTIILPLGISFFTFTQTAYLIDAYRGETKKYSILTYSLFVTVFPHLIAGPILYHKDMIPQFSKVRNYVFSHKNMATGIFFFGIGLFKKAVIADSIAPWVKAIFDNADKVTFIEAWTGAVGYTLQLYYDFSGYSEMAIGLGLMFNLQLPVNFISPYKATSIIDFWRRWHISLSNFLKHYLYIPLGGNKYGELLRLRNLFITMLLGGLWHGAGWTFVVWGGLHGIYLVINHTWRRFKHRLVLPIWLSWLFTFLSVVVAWVFFRANSVNDAIQILSSMLGYKDVVLPGTLEKHLVLLADYGVRFEKYQYLPEGTHEIFVIGILLVLTIVVKEPCLRALQPSIKWAIVISLALAYSILTLNRISEFLYFQF